MRRPGAGAHAHSHLCLLNHTLTNVYEVHLRSPCSRVHGARLNASLAVGVYDAAGVRLRCNFDTVHVHKQEIGSCNEAGSIMSHSW